MWVVTVSDCYWSWVFTCFTFFWWIFAKLKTKVNIGPCLLSGWGFIVFQGGFSLMYVFKVQSNCNYERQAVFFFICFFSRFFRFSIIHHKHFFLATLTDSEREIFYFVSWNVGHWFLFFILEGTARLFINVSMVFSLHLITRSQKSTKMDEFELSGCTKLRYLHDWCCLALLSSFIWLFYFLY